ncbi:hypothetical protein KC19_12G154100, partial [Ceratodon purpureus]
VICDASESEAAVATCTEFVIPLLSISSAVVSDELHEGKQRQSTLRSASVTRIVLSDVSDSAAVSDESGVRE